MSKEEKRSSIWGLQDITVLWWSTSSLAEEVKKEKEGNLFPVIFHLVSLCSDILHVLYQLFAACADRWLLLFEAPLLWPAPPPPPLGKSFKRKANMGYGLLWTLLVAKSASEELLVSICGTQQCLVNILSNFPTENTDKHKNLNVGVGPCVDMFICSAVLARWDSFYAKRQSGGGSWKTGQCGLVWLDTSLHLDKKQLLGFALQSSKRMWSIVPWICDIPIAHIARLTLCVCV